MRLRQVPVVCLCLCGAALAFSTTGNHASSAPAAPSSPLSSSSALLRLRGGAAAASAAGGARADALWGRELPFLYGTAWKKEATTELVVAAVRAGFRGIDTACQPKHYREDLVGAALAQLAAEDGIARDALWLQTKFTPLPGQDPQNVPYDTAEKPAAQASNAPGRRAPRACVPTSSALALASQSHPPLAGGPRLAAWVPTSSLIAPLHRPRVWRPTSPLPPCRRASRSRARSRTCARTGSTRSCCTRRCRRSRRRSTSGARSRRRLTRARSRSSASRTGASRTDFYAPDPARASSELRGRAAGVNVCVRCPDSYDAALFASLYDAARVKPKVLQNRFYDKSGYDKEVVQSV